MQHDATYLEPVELAALSRLAAQAIESAVLARSALPDSELDCMRKEYPRLATPRGAFVTIYVKGQLRGCLGEVLPPDPLANVVARCAARVACADPRFDPPHTGDLPDLSFKISVLTPPRRIASLDEIEIGRHGLILRHNHCSGLLLPEVAAEQNWDAATFVEHTRRKASIADPFDFETMQLEIFETQTIRN